MSTKSKKNEGSENTQKLDSIIASINKEYGSVCLDVNTLRSEEGKLIPTTLAMDIALNGGIPEGTTITIAGMSMSGKTTLVLTIMANCTALGKKCFYLDIESRLNTKLIDTIPGLNKDLFTVIRSTKDKILYAEDYLNIVDQILTSEPGSVICLDSVAVLATANAGTNKIGDSKRLTAIPTLIYDFFRLVAPKIMVNKNILIFITHMQSNPSGYGGPREVGGNAQQYLSSSRMSCLSSKEFPDDSLKKEGRVSTFKIHKAATTSGGTQAEFPILYGSGYDRISDLVTIGESLGFIERAGAWYTVEHEKLKDQKIQGREAVMQKFRDDKELADSFENQIREFVFGKKT